MSDFEVVGLERTHRHGHRYRDTGYSFLVYLLVLIIVFGIGVYVGAVVMPDSKLATNYDDICVNAGYHSSVQVRGDWYCIRPIYGFDGVLMNSEDPAQ